MDERSKEVITVKRQLKRIKGGGFELVPPKTKAARRSVSLGLASIEFLREHEDSQFQEMKYAGKKWVNSGLIFTTSKGTPIDKYNLIKRFKKMIAYADLPPIRFHGLRHTAASLMLNYGIPVIVVSKRLGHPKPSTTLDIYGHLIPSMQEEAAELMDELVSPVKIEVAP